MTTAAQLGLAILATISFNAGAMNPAEVRACAIALASAFDEGLPSPFTVDPEDVNDILSFVDARADFPPQNEPGAMVTTLRRMWRLYRPDLSDARLADRLAPFAKASYSLMVIRRSNRHASVERGRLRLVWQRFLNDVRLPGDPESDARVLLRAEALVVRRHPTYIVGFLNSIVPGSGDSVETVAAALVALHARTLPGAAEYTTANFGNCTEPAAILALWSRYVDALDADAGTPRRQFRVRTWRRQRNHPWWTKTRN